MADIYQNIVALCASRGIKPGRMCNELGLSRSFMTELKSGRAKTITLARAELLAGYFGITVEELMSEDATPTPAEKEKSPSEDGLSDIERQMVEFAKIASPAQLEAINFIINATPQQLEAFIKLSEVAKGLSFDKGAGE